MGDRFNNQPTAELKNSQELDRETFFQLSKSPEGLSSIPEEELKNFSYTTDNIEDIQYIFKFISQKEIFQEIAENEEVNEVIRDEASFFSKIFDEDPILCESGETKLKESVIFIAYINEIKQRLDISWKNKEHDAHIFNELLKKTDSKKASEYPDSLRSSGKISTFLDEQGIVNVEFYGNASKKYLGYAPGYLKAFEKNIEAYFKRRFDTEEVKIHF